MDIFDSLNQIPISTNTTDFRIDSYDGENLLITGSFDFSYYHEVEVKFIDVSYLSLPSMFEYPRFSIASVKEKESIRKLAGLATGTKIYKIEAEAGCSTDKLTFYVAAESVEVRKGIVYYYERENLKENERIAPWVKGSSIS